MKVGAVSVFGAALGSVGESSVMGQKCPMMSGWSRCGTWHLSHSLMTTPRLVPWVGKEEDYEEERRTRGHRRGSDVLLPPD